jgi:outer membrane protein TolC
MLKIALGIDINSDLKLTEKLDVLTANNVDLALTKATFAIDNNINYQMMLNFNEQRRLEYKLQKSKALPSLAANLNFGYNAFNDGFGFFEANQNWFNYSNMGVSLNVPIFSSLARSSRTQQAKIAFDQAKTQLTETEQKLKLQFEKAKSEYEYSIEQYTTSKNSLSLKDRRKDRRQNRRGSPGRHCLKDHREDH